MAADITLSYDFADRILHVKGTEAADTIYLQNNGNSISLAYHNISVRNGASVASWSAIDSSLVYSIQIDALGGDDQITVADFFANVKVQTVITGGAGKDFIQGGSARNIIYGGGGDDTIAGGNGNNYIYGGYDNHDVAAAGLDRTFGFYATDDLHQNKLGLGEKWFKDSKNQAYYILPQGQIYRSTSGGAAGTLLTTVDTGYYTDVFNLVNASKLSAKNATDDLATTQDAAHGFHAPEDVRLNYGGKNEKWILDSNNAAYFILPTGALYAADTTKPGATGTLIATLAPIFYTDLSQLVDAQNLTHETDNDLLQGGNANDVIFGYAGNDLIIGGAGGDYLSGGDGNDTIWGAEEYDIDRYQDGNNRILGDAGNDDLYGGNGPDTMWGGAGNDGLFGGGGTNLLLGEAGNDRFIDDPLDTNTYYDRTAQDVTMHFFNSPAMTNVPPPTGWPTDYPYNYNAGSWSAAEIAAADIAFSDLEKSTNNLKLLRLPNSNNEFTFTRRGQQTSGKWDFGGENDGAGHIVIGQVRNPTLNLQTLQQTIFHEIGHGYDNTTTNSHYKDFMAISSWTFADKAPYPWFTAAASDKPNGWWYLSTAQFARDTAPNYRDYSRTRPAEDYATTWETYFMDVYEGTTLGNLRVQAKYDNVILLLNDLRTP